MRHLFVLLFLFCSLGLWAQKEDAPRAYLKLIAKYYPDKKSVALRFVADKRSVLGIGVNNGYIVERAEVKSKISKAEDLKYHKIGTVAAFTASQWKRALAKADEPLKRRLVFAQKIYQEIKNPSSRKESNGIGDIFAQKKSEDFQFVIMVLTAVQNSEVAEALGMSYTDKTVRKGKKYVYRVKMKKYTGVYHLETIPYLITTSAKTKKKRKIDINVGDGKLGFSWMEEDLISGVFVERKNSAGKFEALNEIPKYSLLQNSLRNGFEDSSLVNYKKYYYRFYGMDPFGEKILFGEVMAMPRDLTPPRSPIMESAKHVKENAIRIRWKMPTPIDGDLKGFTVKRASTVDGDFVAINSRLLSKNTRLIEDEKFDRTGQNYYTVEAIDTAGNKSVSFSSYAVLIDTIAPAIPKIVSLEMDSLGVVQIEIAKNKEQDLMGYRIFWANDSLHEFSYLKEDFKEFGEERNIKFSFKDTVTLRSLSPYVYYRVKALDYHYNQSIFSPIKKVRRVDTIPPTTPVFKNVVVGEDAIELHFALSHSLDIKTHFLYRKLNRHSPWEKLAELKNTQTTYTDKSLKKDQNYFYSIRAMDIHNLFSDYAMPVLGQPYDTGIRQGVQNFKRTEKGKNYIFTWDYPAAKGVYFVLYKSNAKGQLVQYQRTVERTISEKTDGKHTYAIKVFTKDGGQSSLSKKLQIP